ncbi:MAG: DUF3810 domain-containing protein [Clostridiaceae bacterium]
MRQTDSKKHPLSGFIIKTAVSVGLIWLGLSWPKILSGRSAWIEANYSETVYQWIRRAISSVTSLVPFSIAEILLYALVIFCGVFLLAKLYLFASRREGLLRLLKGIASLALAGGILLNLFYITWGFNYFRQPLSERMGLEITQRGTDELEAFVLDTASQAKALRETLHEDEDGVFSPQESWYTVFLDLPQAYETLSATFPVFYSDVTHAKFVLWSEGLSMQGISGIYIGLTAEPNVNVLQPPLLLYQAAAHEMAHQIGIASENEAEFTAFLACENSSDPNVRYSGLIFALIISGNALYQADPDRYIEATETYGDAIWRDLSDYDAYWDSFDGEVQQSADKRNDAYLKHNSQQSGILSYGESVDLLLAYYAQYGLITDNAAAVG